MLSDMKWCLLIVAQEWLHHLVAAGTSLPDGAVAHINMAGTQYTARWQQEEQHWLVVKSDDSTQARPLHLSLEYVDRPLVRLHSVTPSDSDSATTHGSATGSAAADSTGHHHHRMSLLLRAIETSAQAVPQLLFLGSNGVDVAPEVPEGGHHPTVIHCVARGCWGTCLPVTTESQECQQGATSMTALTVRQQRAMVCHLLLVWCCAHTHSQL
jgi:hypothetical protein